MKKIFILPLLFLTCASCFAQKDKYLGVNFNSFGAVHNFRENITKNPIGASFSFVWAPQNSQFQYGLEYGIAMYSAKEYSYELVNEGMPGSFIDVYEEDCFMKYHALGRYFPYRNNGVASYLEVRLGFSSFFSSRHAVEETEHYDDKFEFHGTSFNSGMGGGVQLDFGTITGKNPWPILLDLSATYNTGSNTFYRNASDEEVARDLEDGMRKSVTHSMNYKIGVAIKL